MCCFGPFVLHKVAILEVLGSRQHLVHVVSHSPKPLFSVIEGLFTNQHSLSPNGGGEMCSGLGYIGLGVCLS